MAPTSCGKRGRIQGLTTVILKGPAIGGRVGHRLVHLVQGEFGHRELLQPDQAGADQPDHAPDGLARVHPLAAHLDAVRASSRHRAARRRPGCRPSGSHGRRAAPPGPRPAPSSGSPPAAGGRGRRRSARRPPAASAGGPPPRCRSSSPSGRDRRSGARGRPGPARCGPSRRPARAHRDADRHAGAAERTGGAVDQQGLARQQRPASKPP